MFGDEKLWMDVLNTVLALALSAKEEAWQEVSENVENDELPQVFRCAVCGDGWAPYYSKSLAEYYCSRACLQEGRIRGFLLWEEFKPYIPEPPEAA